MPNPNVTITDIELHEFRAWKEIVIEEGIPVTHWYASAGYQVITDDPDWTWTESLTAELAGAIKTEAADLYATVLAYIKTQKGIS